MISIIKTNPQLGQDLYQVSNYPNSAIPLVLSNYNTFYKLNMHIFFTVLSIFSTVPIITALSGCLDVKFTLLETHRPSTLAIDLSQ